MPVGAARIRWWPVGAVRAGRAAAFLSLATGVNGMLAPYVPGWDPRWLYIATVGLIAALDGWIIGIIAALGAVAAYELMSFGAFGFVRDRDAFLLAAAIVAAIVARALRLAVARPAVSAPKSTHLLPGIVIEGSSRGSSSGDSTSTSAVRKMLEEERSRTERERALRLEQETRNRAAIEKISEELRQAKHTADQMTRHSVDLQSVVDASELTLRATVQRVGDLQRANEELHAAVGEASALRETSAARIAELEATLLDLHATLEREETLRSDARNRVADLEMFNGQLNSALAELAAARDAAVARADEAEQTRDDLARRLSDLEVGKEDSDARAVDLQWSRDRLLQQLAAAEAMQQAAAARAAELEEANAQLRATLSSVQTSHHDSAQKIAMLEDATGQLRAEVEQQRYRLESEWNEKLARSAVEITDRFNNALMAADARADAARAETASLAARAEQLGEENARLHMAEANRSEDLVSAERRIALLEAENAEIRTAAGELRARLEAEWQDKVDEADGRADRLASSLSIAEQRTAFAAAEMAALQERLAAAEDENVRLRAAAENLAAFEEETTRLRAAAQKLDAVETDAAVLREVVDRLQAESVRTAESHAAALQRTEAAWSEKFARSAMDMTQRFQSDLAAVREEAAGLRQAAETAATLLRDLEDENSEIRAAAAADRERLDAEWNEKLETIVHHLASDHDADIGQATLEKEEAKAEVRRLAKRVAQLEGSGREMTVAYELLKARGEALRMDAEEQRARAEAEKQRADTRDAEWSARLATNALELTQRFNGTMAAVDARLQETRREAEGLLLRVAELEQINASLRAEDQERRASIDQEWSTKLETIVSHLASDHEADIGQSMLEREEARAEARMLSSKLAALQKNVAAERSAFEEAKQEWATERDELLGKVEALRRRLGLGTGAGTTPIPAAARPERPAVLVVHRDPAVRAIAKHALEGAGYDVTTAGDGLEAFRVVTTQSVDVVLAETTMPKMDGRELVQMLKSRRETAAVKIILMAGSAEGGQYASADFRADDFLRDPTNVEALKATLANVLAAKV